MIFNPRNLKFELNNEIRSKFRKRKICDCLRAKMSNWNENCGVKHNRYDWIRYFKRRRNEFQNNGERKSKWNWKKLAGAAQYLENRATLSEACLG